MTGWKAQYPDGVREVVAAAVTAAGGMREAEQASGIGRRTLERLLQRVTRGGVPPQISFSEQTAIQLLRWLPQKDRIMLEVCCGRHSIQALNREERRRLANQLGEPPPLGVAFSSVGKMRTARAMDRQNLYTTLRARKELRGLFDGFERDMTKRGLNVSPKGLPHMDFRAQLAYERVLGPLLDADASKGVEPTWEELAGHKVRLRPTGKAKVKPWRSGGSKRRSRLYRVLDWGMRRELVLLDQGAGEFRIVRALEAQRKKLIQREALRMMLFEETAL